MDSIELASRVQQYLLALVVAVAYGACLRRGLRARRGRWSVGSWRRFWLLLACASAAIAAGMGMAAGVDRGVYAGMSAFGRRAYLCGMFTLAFGGALGAAGLLIWFADGRPDRQLG